MPSEETARKLLKECFSKAGYAIEEDHCLQEDGLDVVIDGFDALRRVGYEFITTEAGDRERLSANVLLELEARMHAGRFYVLVIDEIDARGEEGLLEAASAFLDELHRRAAEA